MRYLLQGVCFKGWVWFKGCCEEHVFFLIVFLDKALKYGSKEGGRWKEKGVKNILFSKCACVRLRVCFKGWVWFKGCGEEHVFFLLVFLTIFMLFCAKKREREREREIKWTLN